jgi:hypothetical protein
MKNSSYTNGNQTRDLPAFFAVSTTIALVNKIELFFVPPTSIGEPRSTFCAEFRYVYRILLSDRVSKIQRNLTFYSLPVT